MTTQAEASEASTIERAMQEKTENHSVKQDGLNPQGLNERDQDDEFPEGGLQAWLTVAGAYVDPIILTCSMVWLIQLQLASPFRNLWIYRKFYEINFTITALHR